MKIDLKKFKDPMVVGGISLMREIVAMGYEAYIVGGTVRDLAMGDDNIHDIDIATNMPIDAIKSTWRTIEYGGGEKHGTVIVRYMNHDYELTQFRTDGAYTDSRRPDSVEFVQDFLEDTKRRDFTINAMGIDINGNVIDYHGGLDDIKHNRLQTVGKSVDRFNEDVLRMMRAIRFAARFNFNVSDEVTDAIKQLAHKIPSTSAERIWDELTKIFSYGGDKFANAIVFMVETGVLEIICPEIYESLSTDKIKSIISASTKDPIINMAILSYDIPKDHIKIRDRFKFDNRMLRGIQFISKNMDRYTQLRSLPKDVAFELSTDVDFDRLRRVYVAVNGSDVDGIESQLQTLDELTPILKLSKTVSENMAELGIKPSREFGEIKKKVMEFLYDAYQKHRVIPDADDMKQAINILRGGQ